MRPPLAKVATNRSLLRADNPVVRLVTETKPVATPTGTVTVSWVGVAAVTVARNPPSSTRLLVGFVSNWLPVIVMVDPGCPTVGLNELIVGAMSNVRCVSTT